VDDCVNAEMNLRLPYNAWIFLTNFVGRTLLHEVS
jgi:hypothetical protein